MDNFIPEIIFSILTPDSFLSRSRSGQTIEKVANNLDLKPNVIYAMTIGVFNFLTI